MLKRCPKISQSERAELNVSRGSVVAVSKEQITSKGLTRRDRHQFTKNRERPPRQRDSNHRSTSIKSAAATDKKAVKDFVEQHAGIDRRDRTREYAHAFRENGRFGSHPMHDAFDDGSGPD